VDVVRSVTVTVFPVVGPLPLCAASVVVYVPLAMTVPAPVGVKVTLQLDVVALTDPRVQGEPVKLPAAVPPLVNATVPAGALAVPAAEVSLTNPVHVVACETTIAAGVHDTAVVVVRRVTVTVLPAVGPLPEWILSFGV